MKIIYTSLSDTLCIVTPVLFDVLQKEMPGLTLDEYKQHIWSSSVPADAINPAWVEDSAIPEDGYFRDAWKQNGLKVNVDLPLARGVHLDQLRGLRNEKLKAMDVQYMQALQKKDGSDVVIAQQMQDLRDMPTIFAEDISAINNLNTLKDYTPLILLKVKQ